MLPAVRTIPARARPAPQARRMRRTPPRPGIARCLVLAGLTGAPAAPALGLERSILLRLRDPDDPAAALGPLWLEEGVRDITALGSNTILAIVVLVTVVGLVLTGRPRRGLVLLASAAGLLLVVNLLKIAFGRPRPDLLAELPVLSASFPSSHAAMATAIYLMVALVIAGAAPRPALGHLAVAVAIALGAAIGTSRLYLGVHWPSDVLAGWLLGLLWALATMRIGDRLAARGRLEPMGGAGPRAPDGPDHAAQGGGEPDRPRDRMTGREGARLR
jgi:undecaprenyl-diphosphatase